MVLLHVKRQSRLFFQICKSFGIPLRNEEFPQWPDMLVFKVYQFRDCFNVEKIKYCNHMAIANRNFIALHVKD